MLFCHQNFGFNPDFVEAVQIFWGFSLETFPLPAAFMAARCALISAKAETQEQKLRKKKMNSRQEKKRKLKPKNRDEQFVKGKISNQKKTATAETKKKNSEKPRENNQKPKLKYKN